MRLILSHILHRFDFSLAPPYDSLKDVELKASHIKTRFTWFWRHQLCLQAAEVDRLKFRGVNRGGTMGPMDLERGGRARW